MYKPYVRKDKKVKNILILRYLIAIYISMVASMMYYWKFYKALLSNGFKMNPYDPYVSNDMVNGKQQHNFWNTGDWKFSHVDPKVNDKFIELLI